MTRPATGEETDQIIAALRLWQCVQENRVVLIFPSGGPCGLDYFEGVATSNYQHPALDIEEINTLLDEVYAVAS